MNTASGSGSGRASSTGLRPIGEGKKNFDVLFDDDDLVLTLIGVGRSGEVSYPKTFHIGFIQPSEADVDEVNRRLREDGFDVEPAARRLDVLLHRAGRLRDRGPQLSWVSVR